MNLITRALACTLFISVHHGSALADKPRQECLGRVTFDVPEEMEWATFHADYVHRVSKGGGHGFGIKVGAKGDNATYGTPGDVIYVSDVVDREEFEGAVRYHVGTGELYQKHLIEKAETYADMIRSLQRQMHSNPDVTEEYIERIKQERLKIQQDIPLAIPAIHQLGIPDAVFMGSKSDPIYGYVYRNQRVYYFAARRRIGEGKEAFLDLMSRFQPRELYEIPKGPGVCIPYGFIADNGKEPYSFKNSLRFSSHPNVIFTVLAASANEPWGTSPTEGLYDTDFRPGYDRKKWSFNEYVQSTQLGKDKVNLLGWKLDPKPGSGEQERAWFGFAESGGGKKPLLAVHMLTFKKDTDDLTDYTPPMEEVLPLWEVLGKSMRITLDK